MSVWRSIRAFPRTRQLGLCARNQGDRTAVSLRLENLEPRQLLAVGPQLVSINPNEGEFLEFDGSTRLNVAPRELTIRFDDLQVIDPTTVEEGVRIVRSDFNGSDFSDPITIQPGFVGVGDRENEIVVRFAETLPDDNYRISLDGTGSDAILNEIGQPFNDGADMMVDFELDLGALVTAVVPQPVDLSNGTRTQARNQIVVYFNNDDLDPGSATNPDFYQLIFTNDTVENTDDVVHSPLDNIVYDPVEDTATLTFSANIDALEGAGTYRLRVGTAEQRPDVPVQVDANDDRNSSYDTATDLSAAFGFEFTDVIDVPARSIIISSEIDVNLHPLEYPGADDEPGHRDIVPQTHILGVPVGTDPADVEQGDSLPGITIQAYNFQDVYGTHPVSGAPLQNLITEEQKLRAREIFEFYGTYLGMQFVETADQGLTVATGNLQGGESGPLGTLGIAGGGTAVMDAAEVWNDERGASDDGRLSWFTTAMHEIGHLLGLGHVDELGPTTVMSGILGNPNVFPGDHDIAHGQHRHRPESNDIDLYRFSLDTAGLLTAETLAERQLFDSSARVAGLVGPDGLASSFLDTALTLFRERPDGSREVVARNDDYFSEDSYLEMELGEGTYFIGVTSTGNINYDPTIEDTGLGGTSDGPYELRLGFRPKIEEQPGTGESIVDLTGNALDGDADGVRGGVYNFWFRTAEHVDEATAGDAKTIFVDKSAASGGDGSLATPFDNIPDAFAAASAVPGGLPGDIVRILGNEGADGDISNVADNLAYQIGFDFLGQPLSDGDSMEVPQGVSVMVDAGAVFKLRRATIDVGSSQPAVDRSAGVLQVLGTPGDSVYFTSLNDDEIGGVTNNESGDPDLGDEVKAGDWGGIIFQSDLDRAHNRDQNQSNGRFDFEAEGIFLNYVNHADMRYGGGRIFRDSVEQTITPIHLVDARATISFNRVTNSADAALSANPDSFEESNFHAPDLVNPNFPSLAIFNEDAPHDAYQQVSFTADYDRVGPDIHFNTLVDNTTNGLFVRTRTPAGGEIEFLTVAGRFDDTDVVHVIAENLEITGQGPGLSDVGRRVTDSVGGRILVPLDDTGDSQAILPRTDARLAVDPGTVIKLSGARIEATVGAQFIAEGREGREIIFTSIRDDRYGAGGTFDTNSDAQQGGGSPDDVTDPAPGDWGGVYLGYVGSGSIDHARFFYGGGRTTVEGSFGGFNVVEVHQSQVRIANSEFAFNADGLGGQVSANRGGRGANAAATMFVRGAQPVLIHNTIRDSAGSAVNINANSLNHFIVPDWGRSTGPVDLLAERRDNHGPLIFDNAMAGNDINGVTVRGELLTTQGIWDDTDIVHVVQDEIVVPDFHTFGGLRLESRPHESLVVKLSGPNAGITTTGQALDIVDRIGGSVQVVGQPRFPVVLTSLFDGTVGAGTMPDGSPLMITATPDEPDAPGIDPQSGDWRGVLMQQYSGDRNIKVVTELEPAGIDEAGAVGGQDTNASPESAQFLGALAPHEKSGDDVLRLGFEVNGFISSPGDVDVYSFTAEAGTEVWLDLDRTSQALDSVVELINANGTVLARSDNAYAEFRTIAESLEVGDPGFEQLFIHPNVFRNDGQRQDVNILNESLFLAKRDDQRPDNQALNKDHWSVNAFDAGMRVVLPEPVGTVNTYHVRVRSSNPDIGTPEDEQDPAGGLTSGAYQLNVRLREIDEIAGSSIQFADFRYASTPVDVQGQPGHSPLLGEAAEDGTPNDTIVNAQPIGNPLISDRAAISVAGALDSATDVDWYTFEIGHTATQSSGAPASIVFDIDYADGFAKPDTYIAVYDIDGNLVLSGTESDIADDVAAPSEGADVDDLSRGSNGKRDPFIGPIELPGANPDGSTPATYFIAVTSDALRPAELIGQMTDGAAANPLLRIEPVDSITRIAEDHVPVQGGSTADAPRVDLTDVESVVPWHLGDVVLFASTNVGSATLLSTLNPFTGTTVTTVGRDELGIGPGTGTGDIAMRTDGQLFGMSIPFVPATDANTGNFLNISTVDGTTTNLGDDTIQTFVFNDDRDGPDAANDGAGAGIFFNALEFVGRGPGDEQLFAAGDRGDHIQTGQAHDDPQLLVPDFYSENILYRFDGFAFTPEPPELRDNDEIIAGGAFTDVVEVGYIRTNIDAAAAQDNVLVAVDATIFLGDPVTLFGDPTIPIISDGDRIVVDNPGNPPVIFEFDTGPEAYVDFELELGAADPTFVNDAMRFSLTDNDGGGTKEYKFETGPVISIVGTSSTFTDGDTFTITDDTANVITFEIDNDGTLTNTDHIPVDVSAPAGTELGPAIIKDRFIDAINSPAANFRVAAIDGPIERITLINDDLAAGVTTSLNPTGFAVLRSEPMAGDTLIFVEETDPEQAVRRAIRDAFVPDIGSDFEISIDGARMNWQGIEDANLSQAPILLANVPGTIVDPTDPTDFGDPVGVPGVGTGAVAIPFGADDSDVDIAALIAGAINANATLGGIGVSAAVIGSNVELTGGSYIPGVRNEDPPNPEQTFDPPFIIGGGAPGGTVTGLAEIGGTLYAITGAPGSTDGNDGDLPGGGLFVVDQGTAAADYVDTATDLVGIDFTTLVAGPTTVEEGKYANMLFGLDSAGMLHAFDTDGRLQPIFVDGQTSVDTGLVGANGLAFSTLERNLWHTSTDDRHNGDPGHGLNVPISDTRGEQDGGVSFYFGNETEVYPDGDLGEPTRFTYDYPGGAHGSLVTNVFDLSGYTSFDQPVLYFNYFLETEDLNGNGPDTEDPIADSFRVFVQDNSETAPLDLFGNPTQGRWHLLGTNNNFRDPDDLDEFDAPFLSTINDNDNAQNYGNIQEFFDNTGGWRQARIPLNSFAGSDDLRLRFDFSTAGSMELGVAATTGSELRAIAGSRWSVGDTFSIDGTTFEFDLGHVLAFPTAAGIADGELLTIEDGGGTVVTFEFDKDETSNPANTAILLTGTESAEKIVAAVRAAITGSALTGIVMHAADHRLDFTGAADVTQSANPGVVVEDEPETAGDPAVVIHLEMTSEEVAAAIQAAVEAAFTVTPGSDTVKVFKDTVKIIGHAITDQGPLGAAASLAGDGFGVFRSSFEVPGALRGQNNVFEGVHIDDLIIGLAERGEIVTAAAGDTTFAPNLFLPDNAAIQSVLVGNYQLEIRRGPEYTIGDSPNLPLRSFDSNDRLSQEFSLFAPSGADVDDGRLLIIGDGNDTFTFEFEDLTTSNGVAEGNVAIPFLPSDPSHLVAQAIVDAINSVAQTSSNSTVETIDRLDITASVVSRPDPDPLNFGQFVPVTNRIELFGETVVVDISQLRVTETTSDGNALRDIILGEGITPIGDAEFVGSGISAGIFEDGASTIGIDSGIILTTGNASFAAGPNEEDGSSDDASLIGDADLDAEFGVTTLDTTYIEFDFEISEEADLSFNFVFASEEYNEFVNDIFNDVFGFFIDGENIGLVPGTTDPVSVNSINGGNPLGVDASNGGFYNNNDPDDDGEFLQQFGYDGFTDVFTAVKTGLAAGMHTMKLAISDVGDTVWDSAVFIAAESFSTEAVALSGIAGIRHDWIGDSNRFRDQGQLIIDSSRFIHSGGFGVSVDAAPRDGQDGDIPHQAPPRFLSEVNTERLTPGVTITNSIFAANIGGGILFSGDNNSAGQQLAAVPFGRIVNNTIHGVLSGDVGIQISDNASPTILNNILSNLDTAIDIDATSGTTILGGILYKDNNVDSTSTLGDFPINLDGNDPLFVDAANLNFYLAEQSRAIDSSVDSLEDRLSMITVREPLGIARSPILAPDRDLLGQLRSDDPDVEPPDGFGGNVFKDRGALDRVDFVGPSAILLDPADNDTAGDDQNPARTFVWLPGIAPRQFVIQLVDGTEITDSLEGTGVNDLSVTSAAVVLRRNNRILEEGLDYSFEYDTTNDTIRLIPLTGVWADGTYSISLNNESPDGIVDLAGNPLRPNRASLKTAFTIDVGDLNKDFGDAPDATIDPSTTYPTLAEKDGARHIVDDILFLGTLIDVELEGQPTVASDGDDSNNLDDDDGVSFDTPLAVGQDATITVTASAAGLLDAWVDFNADGDWDDPGEQIVIGAIGENGELAAGENEIVFGVPIDAVSATTYARFRLSTAGGLSPSGLASDGEVEDYQVNVSGNPWHNALMREDVNGLGGAIPVDALDALIIINEINNPVFAIDAVGTLPIPPQAPNLPPPFLDVNDDGHVDVNDVIIVINFINALPASASAAAVGDASASAATDESSVTVATPLAAFEVAAKSESVMIDPAMAIEWPTADAGLTADHGPTLVERLSTDQWMSELAACEPIDDRLLLVPGRASAARVADPAESLASLATDDDQSEVDYVELYGEEEVDSDAIDQLFASWHGLS